MGQGHGFWDDPATWVAVAFVLFFILFGGKAWAALTGILDQRADQVRAELAEAQRLRSEAEAMLRDATARREEALTVAQRLIAGARAEATRLSAEAAVEAQAANARRERMAGERIDAAEKAVLQDVRVLAAEIATAAAERVIRESFSASAGAALVDRAISGLPAALAARTAA